MQHFTPVGNERRSQTQWLAAGALFASALTVACTGSIAGNRGSDEPSGQGGGGDSNPGGSTGNGGSTGSGGNPAQSACLNPQPFAAAAQARLSRRQYLNTLATLFDASVIPTATLDTVPEDPGAGIFSYSVVGQGASSDLVTAYSNVAGEIAESTRLTVTQLAPCAGGANQTTCGRQFVTAFGQKAFRRPLTTAEVDRWTGYFSSRLTAENYDHAIRQTVEAFLQAPQFLFLLQQGVAVDGATDRFTLDSYERAASLSYLLTDGPPDAQLSAHAAAGELSNENLVLSEATRLLTTAAGQAVIARFNQEWLQTGKLTQLVRRSQGTALTEPVMQSLRRGLEMFVKNAYDNADGMAGLLSSSHAFVDSNTAGLYGVNAPGGGTLGQVDLDTGRRAGLLTQAGWLTIHANEDTDAPVRRGVFVMDRILCAPPPPPPGNVNTVIPPPTANDPPRTTRMRLEQAHMTSNVCAVCHASFDGAGFAFGNYDAAGRWRDGETSKGVDLPIDASGELHDTDIDGKFANGVELANRLTGSKQVAACLATQWLRFGLGRDEQDSDACATERALDALSRTGDLKQLPMQLAIAQVLGQRQGVQP